MDPRESAIASLGLASSWHAEVIGTRDGWRHCRPVGRVAPSFHASIWEAALSQLDLQTEPASGTDLGAPAAGDGDQQPMPYKFSEGRRHKFPRPDTE